MILIPSIGALLLGYGIKDLVKFFNSGFRICDERSHHVYLRNYILWHYD